MPPDVSPRSIGRSSGLADRLFRQGMRGGGIAVLVITGGIGLFLSLRAVDALRVQGLRFFTTQAWQPDVHRFGVAAILPFTVMIAVVAVTVSTPLATGTALFISEVAGGWIKRWLVSGIDLMSAVPSVVYGLWGVNFFQNHLIGVARWLATWFGWVPLFRVSGADPHNPLATPTVYTASVFCAGTVVGLMIIPIQCSIMREVFSQAPAGEREAAYALGSTRWGMIRAVVLPFGRGGMIGGTLLALGRALGETVAVYLIISPTFHFSIQILHKGAISVSALIATYYSDSSHLGLSALFAAGLALFVLTLIVNFTASIVVNRSRSGALSDV